jgi:hypothetical protein
MRNGQNNKRMRGRNRNHKSHHSGGGGGGGGHHHNPLTRVYESNGPEVKIRGTAHHVAEKYLQLARDAQSSGDPVTAENHFQHAEHYLRLIAAAQEQFRQQNPYYQAPPSPGQSAADEGMDGEDEGAQPTQGQGAPGQGAPSSGASQSGFGQPSQPQQNFNNTQSYGGGQPNYNNQQPNYQPREQPQPYGGQPPAYQSRPQQQPYNNQPQQPPQYQPPQPQAPANDGDRLPSFITGAQPQPAVPQSSGDQGGERYPRHRRRRHRGGGPRPEMAGTGPQEIGGGEGPEPGNT